MKTYLISLLLLSGHNASASDDKTCTFNSLPTECLAMIVGCLNTKTCAITACVSTELRETVNRCKAGHSDGVQLDDDSWVFVQEALAQDDNKESKTIKNFHSKLNSSRMLRSSLIQSSSAKALTILSDPNLSLEQKKEHRDDFHRHVMNLGLISSLPVSNTPAERLADLVVGLQLWDQVRTNVRAKVWSQIDDQVIRAQFDAQASDQSWAKVRAQVWFKIRAQVWFQVRIQIKALLLETSCVHFNFTEENLAIRQPSAMDHSMLVHQLAGLAMLHTAEIQTVRNEAAKVLGNSMPPEQIEAILDGLNIPSSNDAKTDSFLELLRRSVAKPDTNEESLLF